MIKFKYKKPFIKSKIKGFKNSSGRNNSGVITIRHKGGGHKRRYRIVDFNRNRKSLGIVTSVEYDPNRSSNIAAVYEYSDKRFFYMLAPKFLKSGDLIESGYKNFKLGCSLPVEHMPKGTSVNCLATSAKKSAKLARSAGTSAQLEHVESGVASIKLSSKKKIKISSNSIGTIGVVSNVKHFLKKIGKAGRARWLNVRPSVRGVAMNPVDHPHGGGEGKKSGFRRTPWGKTLKSPNKPKTHKLNNSNKMEKSLYKNRKSQ